MSKSLTDEIHTEIKHLIRSITRFEPNSDEFKTAEKNALTALRKSDTMYFLTTKDIKTAILSMAEKFSFHGFFKHSDYLKQAHDRYIDPKLTESDLSPRLNTVKLLLCLSQNPTNEFWKDPDKFGFIDSVPAEEEVVEDWGAYLNEGIERWSPCKDESFELSDSGEENASKRHGPPERASRPPLITESRLAEPYDLKSCRDELMGAVQHGWFDGGVCMEPPSEWFDAKVGLLWEQHLQSEVHGLITIEPLTVISEYKVMREVLWQLWAPHNSTVFRLEGDKLALRENVTIASVRSMAFEEFLRVFLPYIEIFSEFRGFFKRLECEGVPETYKSYANAVQKILRPIFGELVEIENEIREQETTMTLLKLAGKLETLFEPIRVLSKIHRDVIIDFGHESSMTCALTLLTRLRHSLHFSVNKLEQDIRLTLYIESLYYYFTIINSWLVKNDLADYTGEFLIENQNARNSKQLIEDSAMNFSLRSGAEAFRAQDGIVRILSDQVLELGRNLHLLRLLGKYDVFPKGCETLHQEFQRRILEEMAQFYDSQLQDEANTEAEPILANFSVNGMGDWHEFVDGSDGFLVKAFEGFFVGEGAKPHPDLGLLHRVAQITQNLFPWQSLPEKVLSQILKERFTISGLMVKNLLIEKFLLDKQFDFLSHIFLFNDDLIFPFYRRIFEKMNTAHASWGNGVWLTSHLHDVIMDLYPNFYEKCSVQVDDLWKNCRDSIEAVKLLSVQYEIEWPLSIIITKEQVELYRELFLFILYIKWALYTVNHLSFADIEPKSRALRRRPPTPIKRLRLLRFNLINLLNTIQHYVFGFINLKQRNQFELDFEKSDDLKSLIKSHDDFISSVHKSLGEIQHGNGFITLLKAVKMLKVMWNEREYATAANLEKCYKAYGDAFGPINQVVSPVYVYDY